MLKNISYRPFWIISSLIYTIIIFYLCLRRPGEAKPQIPHLDKLLHLFCYLAYAYLLGIVIKRKYWIGILLYCVFFGVLIEVLQKWTGYRSFEYADMLANSLGAVIGVSLSKWSIKKEPQSL